MHARLWLALACVAGALLVWWIAAGAEAAPRVEAQAPRALVEASPAASELRAPAGPDELAVAPRVRVPAALAEVETDSGPRRRAHGSHGPVVVRVQLLLASGGEGSFASWRVEAQSWIEETNATFPHEARANAAGVAEFRFPGFVHIDWLRCVPPPESGLAMAFAEHHADLEPGETFEDALELAPGGVIHTRVVDTHDEPVSGATVHAYADVLASDPIEWQPGLVHARSGPDGGVALPPLPPGEWGLFVEPDEWLQVEPTPDDERGVLELAAGSSEAAILRVVPLHRFRVHALDASGQAVPEAAVFLEPLDLSAHGLATREPDEPEPLDLFLERANPPEPGNEPPLWPYGEFAWTTDEHGKTAAFGITGTWALTVMPRLARGKGDAASVRRELTLPCGDQTVRVPSVMVDLCGRVEDFAGQPIAGAELRLRRSGSENLLAATRTERDGAFALRGLLPGAEYVLEASDDDHVPAARLVRVTADSEPAQFELRRAGRVRLRFVEASGAPVEQREVSILSSTPDEPLRSPESDWLAEHPNRSSTTDDDGRIELYPLPPGAIEVGLFMPIASGATDTFGNPVVTRGVVQRWTVRVQEDEQQLVVDLSSYAPPQASRDPVHRGVVLDGRTREPVGGAWLCLRAGGGQYHGFTNAKGRFQFPPLAGPYSFSVLKRGYLRLEVPERESSPGQNEHSLALEPGGLELELEFADRDGTRLPRVEVGVSDEAGQAVLAWVETGGRGFAASGPSISTDGRMTMSSIPPGRLHFRLAIAGHELGSCSFELGDGRAPQSATLRLERTLAEMQREIERELQEE